MVCGVGVMVRGVGVMVRGVADRAAVEAVAVRVLVATEVVVVRQASNRDSGLGTARGWVNQLNIKGSEKLAKPKKKINEKWSLKLI